MIKPIIKNDKQTIYEKNDMINKLSELESNARKARTLIYDLLEEYNLRDEDEMSDKLKFEAIRVMSFIEISADYISSTYNKIVSIQDELQQQVDNIKEGIKQNE